MVIVNRSQSETFSAGGHLMYASNELTFTGVIECGRSMGDVFRRSVLSLREAEGEVALGQLRRGVGGRWWWWTFSKGGSWSAVSKLTELSSSSSPVSRLSSSSVSSVVVICCWSSGSSSLSSLSAASVSSSSQLHGGRLFSRREHSSQDISASVSEPRSVSRSMEQEHELALHRLIESESKNI